MLKYVGLGMLAFVAAFVIGTEAQPSERADAFENETVGSCNNTVTFNPGMDPILIPNPVNMGATIHEINGNMAETHIRLFPTQSLAASEPMLSGTTTFDTNTADFEGTGSGTYFNPTEYSMEGQFNLLTGTQIPTGFEGDIQFRQIGGTQPNFDLHLICTFEPPPFSIVVLAINGGTNGPLANWGMELYANDDCSGDPIDSGETNDDGIIDFIGLNTGTYSVLQDSDPGFEPEDGNLCREDIAVPGPSDTAGDGEFIDCPITNGEFPAPGCDSFQSGGQVNIELAAGGEPFTVTLNGPTTIVRETAPQDVTAYPPAGRALPAGPSGNGLDEVETEMIQLDLQGLTSMFGTVHVHQSPTRATHGLFEEQVDDTPGEMDFPADSFFDVFFEIDITGVDTVYNQDPMRLECVINEIPPLLCLYQPPIDDPIELYRQDNDQLFAYIVHAAHVPIPLGEVFIVFTNVPVEEKLLIQGDFDCDGDADAVDALVLLSFVAGLTPNQNEPCPTLDTLVTIAGIDLLWGDVDCDGDVDAADALKILQFVAGIPFTQESPCPTILDP